LEKSARVRVINTKIFNCYGNRKLDLSRASISLVHYIYRVFREQADWTLTHMSHKDTEQSTREASITLDDVTLFDSLIRWSSNE
jgi:hypothetical protein